MRTRGAHGRIVARYGVAVILFGALDNPLSHLCNFLHEGIAIHLALLNQRQFVFPVSREIWARQLFNIEPAQ